MHPCLRPACLTRALIALLTSLAPLAWAEPLSATAQIVGGDVGTARSEAVREILWEVGMRGGAVVRSQSALIGGSLHETTLVRSTFRIKRFQIIHEEIADDRLRLTADIEQEEAGVDRDDEERDGDRNRRAERQADQREELNALYVALTRARSSLVVSAHEPFRGDRNASWWTRLTQTPVLSQAEPWCPQPSHDAPLEVLPVSLLTLPGAPARAQAAAVGPDEQATVPPEDAEGALLRVLGQVVHRGLELLTALPVGQREPSRVSKAVHAAAQALQLPPGHWRDAVERVSTILAQPELQRWLDPQALRWAGNEVTLSDGGDILRIDRLVAVDTPAGPAWWVIDYKLGEQPLAMAAYHAQMARYVEVVRRLQPGETVQGAFVTGSGQWVPWREP